MNDDLDLRVIERDHDADPRFREALRQRVSAILDGREVPPADDTAPEAAVIDVVAQRVVRPEHDRRRWVASAAALVGAAALIVGLVVVTSGDDSWSPAESVPPTLFTEIGPGEMVDLPGAPIIARSESAAVWTGTEMIVWGGIGYGPDTDGWATFSDGAAFNLASGTWRVIAPAPLSARQRPAAAWTGTELIVWGGSNPGDPDSEQDDVTLYDGAAYNPATDTWRMLPPAPSGLGSSFFLGMAWTGQEVVVSGGVIAAYDPVTDRWRHLANRDVEGYPTWTGDAIVWTGLADSVGRLTRYDVAADSWTVVDGSYAEVVGVPGSDGIVSTLVALPSETGAPTHILDSDLNPTGELPAFPGDPSLFGDRVGASATWVGTEAIFHIWPDVFPYEPTQVWTLDPTTQTWRRLDDKVPEGLVVVGDVMLAWGDENGPAGEYGVAYRSGTTTSD